MKIKICIGSSCHLKNSREIIQLFEENIAKYNLNLDVELVGSFCMGKCSNVGVTVQIDEEPCLSVTPANFNDIFKENVLSKFIC